MLITNNIISKYRDFLQKEIQLSHDRQHHRLDLILIEFVFQRTSFHFLLFFVLLLSLFKQAFSKDKVSFRGIYSSLSASAIIQTVNVGASVASARPASENRRRSTRQSMSSTPTPGRPSMPTIINKKSSSATNDFISPTNINRTKRATSSENFRSIIAPTMKKESSSGFNYQSLTESSPSNISRNKIKLKTPVRSHSSTNAELSYHLQQLKNLGRRKTTLSGENRNNNNDDRIHLTSSNLKVECDENGVGTSIHTTMELETIEASIELPVSWKPAIQQITIQRDAWDHKVEFLLAVIGYAVDLGRKKIDLFFTRRYFFVVC